MSWVPVDPPPPNGEGYGDGDPPPVRCGVDRGGAHRIHRGRIPLMVMLLPPPCGMWGAGALGIQHASMHTCQACICLHAYAIHAYVDVDA